jgi:SecD/SecF fusion protein
MMNKNFITAVSIIVTLLCLYYLSFTLISSGVQNDATEYATDSKGNIDYYKKTKYLDSIWSLPVYDLGFAQYTYKEVKDRELHLGLDLQGGMHVVLEVSPIEIITSMSGNSNDENFKKALKAAKEVKGGQEDFASIFFNEYEKLAGQNQLGKIFANAANQGMIEATTGDAEIKRIITSEVENAIDRSYNIIKTRIDKFGVTQPNVQRIPNSGRIQVELPGVDNPERVRKLLQGVAKLEFWEVWEGNEYNESMMAINAYLLKKEKNSKDTTKKADNTKTEDLSALVANNDTLKAEGSTDSTKITAEAKTDSSQAKTDSTALAKADSIKQPEGISSFFAKMVRFQGIPDLVYEAGDTVAINRILNDDGVKSLLPNNLKFIWDVKAMQKDKNDNSGKSYYQLYAIKKGKGGKAPLGGEVITNARQGFDERGRADISMSMNAEGARLWKKLTGANVNRRVAIVLDNFVYSAPVVQNEISGGQSSITGNFTIEEAKDLANILKAGKLPAPTRIVEEAVVGPSLGQESIQQGLMSVLVGFLLVVVFMAVYYASSGWVANASLMVNVFFIVGILAQLSASLTLPGIAGIVLTIGMAVDANVLIFERIREEMRGGKTLTQSISDGFARAFWTIFDSNITTLLTAFFLYSFGTGPIKGFAITLMIGIICSFFTAVFISRVIIEWIIAKKGDQSNLSFYLPFSKNLFTKMNFPYIQKRKIAYAISGSIIVVGFSLIAIQGLNFGVDFKGGRTFIVEFNEKVIASDIRSALVDDFEGKGTEVKTYGSNNKIKVTTVYLIDDDSDEADAKVTSALTAGLKDFEKLAPKVVSTSKVGATVASDIRDSAFWAVFTSLLAIFGYIVVRFRKWQFGLGAVVALFHDVLITFAMTAIVRNLGLSYEIDQVFVAAILTIIGYSINDTVVVFDRIREYLSNNTEKTSMTETLNEAIGSTFSRTFITAFTTFIVVFILFIAGGEVLKGFSFAMIIGLVFGTYSSIFIATAIVSDTISEKEYKQMEEQSLITKPAVGAATKKEPKIKAAKV